MHTTLLILCFLAFTTMAAEPTPAPGEKKDKDGVDKLVEFLAAPEFTAATNALKSLGVCNSSLVEHQ